MEGNKVKKKCDNCNRIINKIYFNKQKKEREKTERERGFKYF